jgi:drug/metabolite transporter (DMT)-like permease
MGTQILDSFDYTASQSLPEPCMRTFLLTAIALAAFAANSLLCRLALGEQTIDAASFTLIRVLSGALTLAVLVRFRQRRTTASHADWRATAALMVYMTGFSFAYLSLSAGTGALLLFGAVQLTMFAVALRAGERYSALSWSGLVIAFGGLAWLVAPGVTAPPLPGTVLMLIAGVGWGVYSLRGRSVGDPLAATAANFLRAVPVAALLMLPFLAMIELSATGIALAIASGALASGIGYAVWYAALPALAAGTAATVQLMVPPLTALVGVFLLDEALTLRLVLASAAVLGGIALVVHQSKRRTPALDKPGTPTRQSD